jgi:hypothetical protein
MPQPPLAHSRTVILEQATITSTFLVIQIILPLVLYITYAGKLNKEKKQVGLAKFLHFLEEMST